MTQEFSPKKSYLALKAHENMVAFIADYLGVEVGDEVKKGQVVAHMGETGRATGPNLHFEVLKDGGRVNPVNFIRDSGK